MSAPYEVNHQGRLTDNCGTPVADGTYTITFSIWDEETLGSNLWSEEHSVTVTISIYHVTLRTGSTLVGQRNSNVKVSGNSKTR